MTAARTARRNTGWVNALIGACCLVAATCSPGEVNPKPLTVEDAIAMVRIQHRATAGNAVGAFSPDGKRFAAVTSRGDLSRNVSVYSLVVFDISEAGLGRNPPRAVLTWDFAGDAFDQYASAFEQLTFLGDNQTVAFLGRKGGASRQVYSVNVDTGRLLQLTNHPTDVKAFAIGRDGTARFFAAAVDADEHQGRLKKLDEDGVFMWDTSLFVVDEGFKAGPALTLQPRWSRQYFVQRRQRPTLVFDSRRSRPKTLSVSDKERERGISLQLYDEEMLRRWSSVTADSRGRYALMFPYAEADKPVDTKRYKHYQKADGKLDAPYALIDLATGRLQRFIDAPHPSMGRGNGDPVWAPDGRSVAIYTLLPAGTQAGSDDELPQWVQVDVETRKLTPLNVPAEWQVTGWAADGNELVLYEKHKGFALLGKSAERRWGEFRQLDAASKINPIWQPAINGHWLVGVKDATYSAPELIALNLVTGASTTLTDLNPQLRQRPYGSVEVFSWTHPYDAAASGFLVKPLDFQPGRRYPLVVLLDDGTLSMTKDPYLLDAAFQLSGHAIQMLAANGFLVLYTREPRKLFDSSDGSTEGQRITEHVDSAIARLDQEGLIDPERVGISGWSRAAYHVDCILMRSSHRLAAATRIDGGGREYLPTMRPFTDDELQRIRTPLLIEPHGLINLIRMTAMADRLEAFDRPTEVLYFASASHSTIRPQHRLRSLQTHLDWWRFWLKREEDENPEKVDQYARWRAMRATWEGTARLSSEAVSR